jgi:transposase
LFHYTVILNAIKLQQQYNSFNKVAKELSLKQKISRQTISNWYKKYQNIIDFLEERIAKTYKHKEQIIVKDLNITNFIYKNIYENPFIKRSELIVKIKDKFDIKYNLNQISKIYKQLKLTFKKPKYRVIKNIKFLDELIVKRQEFVTNIKKENIDKIISIDESGFNSLIKNVKGLSKKGSTIHQPVSSIKNNNVSLIMAITTNKILHNKEITSNVNGEIFFSFIKEVINKLTDKEYIFLFDNVSFHKNKEMLKYITDMGHKYMFTPPYSPNLNPIENTFSIIKQKYNNNSNNSNKQHKIIIKIKKIIENFPKMKINLAKIFNRAFNYDYTIENNEIRDRLIIIDKQQKEIKEEKLKIKKKQTKKEIIKEKEILLAKKFPTFNIKIKN